MSSLANGESELRPQIYCRKEKSLGVLCSNFLGLYNGDCVSTNTIGLDDAASQLGVERRRMYDVVNILESIGVVARKAKNQYTWNGLDEIPRRLEQLKREGLKENLNNAGCCSSSDRVPNENEYGGLLGLNTGGEGYPLASLRKNNKSDKSLALLSQNFIKLFLYSDVDMILLDNAAKALPGEADDATTLRTKVRRLYDIANVLSSMNLIEKVRHFESGKPAFRWLGWKGKLNNADTASDLNEPKKRLFGSDITNHILKKKRTDSVLGWKSNKETSLQMHNKQADLEPEYDGSEVNQYPRHNLKVIDFGPFAPLVVSKARDAAAENIKQVRNWESLASTYRPQYHNKATKM